MELKIEYIPKEELKPYFHNAKLHPSEQVEQIKKSIQDFGFNDPIAIHGDNEVVEGHGRLLAVMDMPEITTVPVIRLDHLTDEEKRAYSLVHNKLTMNSDFDLTIEEVNTLYEIAKRLKENLDERINTKKILAKNPSAAMYQREADAKERYQKALQDYNYWLENFVAYKDENKINKIQRERLLKYIQTETTKIINDYFDNNEKEEN